MFIYFLVWRLSSIPFKNEKNEQFCTTIKSKSVFHSFRLTLLSNPLSQHRFTNLLLNFTANLLRKNSGLRGDYQLWWNFVQAWKENMSDINYVGLILLKLLELKHSSPDFVYGFSSYDEHLFKPRGVWNKSALLIFKVNKKN